MRFMFAASVGEQDERDLVLLQVGERLRGARDRGSGAEQYTIDTVRVGSTSAVRQRVPMNAAYSNAKAKSGGSFFAAGVLPESLRDGFH
jgi:hypothetical protein